MSLIRSRLAYGRKPVRYACASFTSTCVVGAKVRKPPPILPPPEQRVQLPPVSEWKNMFPAIKPTRGRLSIASEAAAQHVANAFVPEGSKGKTIIEAYPGALLNHGSRVFSKLSKGPGQLTRALLNLPKERVEKLIVLEDIPEYLEWLQVRILQAFLGLNI